MESNYLNRTQERPGRELLSWNPRRRQPPGKSGTSDRAKVVNMGWKNGAFP
jgi:hypothetical protein